METEIITPEIKEKDSSQILDKIRDDFIGYNTKYTSDAEKSLQNYQINMDL